MHMSAVISSEPGTPGFFPMPFAARLGLDRPQLPVHPAQRSGC
jgi:hypothetical protein